jgi:hypothetical protein
MALASGMGDGHWPPKSDSAGLTFFHDRDAARRLRDRVAREIAAVIDGGGDGAQCADLTPVYRWLNAISEESE